MNIHIVKYDQSFLDYSWKWLSDPEIKRMTDAPNFTREMQKRWFVDLPSKEDYKIWGILADKTPIGACGLKNITKEDCEIWFYIGERSFWGQGIGKILIALMEKEAGKLCVKSIWLQVMNDNQRCVTLFLNQGYVIEEQRQGRFIMRGYL